MNTTPNPRATKKSNGELGPPLLSFPPFVPWFELACAPGGNVAVAEAAADVDDMVVIEDR